MKRIAVFVSGGGTNLQALIDSQGSVLKSGKIALVVANNADAYSLERAKKAGIDTAVVLKKECGSQAAFEEKLKEVLTAHSIDIIVLAGFMTILTENFTSAYPKRITGSDYSSDIARILKIIQYNIFSAIYYFTRRCGFVKYFRSNKNSLR